MPSNIHTPLVSSVTNDNSSLTQKNTLKIEAQLSALKSCPDCELSALTSKIHAFSDSIKNILSDLQNKERENSQIGVLKKNITLLQNEIKSKDTIIESLLETQKTLMKHLSNQISKIFQSTENRSQQQLWQHQDHYQHHPNTSNNIRKAKHGQTLATVSWKFEKQESSPFCRNNPPH